MPQRAWSSGLPNSVASRILWEKKRLRHPAIDEDATRVPLGHQPPDSLRLPPQTQFMAQPDRDLFRHSPEKMPAWRQLHLGARPRVPTPSVHYVRQHDDGPPVPLDLHGQTARKEASPPFRAAAPPRQDATPAQTTKPRPLMKLGFRVVALGPRPRSVEPMSGRSLAFSRPTIG